MKSDRMKKIWKPLLIGFSVLIVLIGIASILALDKVDTTPYFETAYYQSTKARLDSTLANVKADRGPLKAGFGRINITPRTPVAKEDPRNGLFANVYLAGYGDRASAAVSVHDSIYARAVAFQVNARPLVFVGTDLLLMPPAVADSVQILLAKEAGMTRDQLYFGATHTHSSAGSFSDGWVGKQFAGEFQPAFVSWLSRRIVQAVVAAVADLQPARIGVSDFKADQYVRNRMIGETGRLNDIFTFVSIEQDNGRKGVIGAFAAHATTLGEENLAFSGDYPGYWERKLEREAVDLAVFFAGTVGSHTYSSQGSGFEKARYIGEALADSVRVRLAQTPLRDTVTFTHFSSIMDLPDMQIRVADRIHLDPYIGNRLIPGTYDPMIQALKIDQFIWMTLPCELSGEYAVDLKNALALRGYRSMFTTFNGDYLGYVTPQKYYHHDSYESFLMGWYGHHMGDYIMELLFTSCRMLTGERL